MKNCPRIITSAHGLKKFLKTKPTKQIEALLFGRAAKPPNESPKFEKP
jgi:hypothetical protein